VAGGHEHDASPVSTVGQDVSLFYKGLFFVFELRWGFEIAVGVGG